MSISINEKFFEDYTKAQERHERLQKVDCMICFDEAQDRGDIDEFVSVMIVCPECGCKRCPKATWHNNPCTHSNDPGKKGSYYGKPPYKLDSKEQS
jgi:hypothetical protein